MIVWTRQQFFSGDEGHIGSQPREEGDEGTRRKRLLEGERGQRNPNIVKGTDASIDRERERVNPTRRVVNPKILTSENFTFDGGGFCCMPYLEGSLLIFVRTRLKVPGESLKKYVDFCSNRVESPRRKLKKYRVECPRRKSQEIGTFIATDWFTRTFFHLSGTSFGTSGGWKFRKKEMPETRLFWIGFLTCLKRQLNCL